MTATSLSGAGVQESPWLEPQANVSPRILVVDDDVSMRTINTKVLLRFGYQVDAAEDGSAAWQALNAELYDLMITDNKMPKLSGIELLKKLRASRMSLPVIMATGTLPTEEFIRHPWLQPDATLLKPYTLKELVGVVKEVLRATGGDREQIEPPPPRPLDNRLPL